MQNLSLFILLRMEMGVLEGCGIAYYLVNGMNCFIGCQLKS